MLKGGYQILDLGGIDISSGTVKIDGIYDKIVNTTGKPFLLSGLNIGNGVLKDRFITLDIGEEFSYFGNISNDTVIYIDGDDTVYVDKLEPSGGAQFEEISGLHNKLTWDSSNVCWKLNGNKLNPGTYVLKEEENFGGNFVAKGTIVVVRSTEDFGGGGEVIILGPGPIGSLTGYGTRSNSQNDFTFLPFGN